MPIELLRAYGLIISESCDGVERGWRMVTDRFHRAVYSAGENEPDDQPRMKDNFGRSWDGLLLVITHSAALSRALFPIPPRKIKGEPKDSYTRRSDEREQVRVTASCLARGG